MCVKSLKNIAYDRPIILHFSL